MAEMKQNPLSSLDASASLDGRISVMPQAYLPKAKGGLSTKTLLLILGGLIVVALVAVIIALFVSQSRQSAQLAQQQDAASQQQQAAQPQTNQTQQPSTTQEATSPSSSGAIQQVDEEVETVSQPVVLPDVSAQIIPPGVDTDQDGLTDLEEQLFATSPAVPDTDQDSFLDGAELLNLYDPASPRALLEVSPQIKIARNDSRGYQFYIPVAWTASKQTPDGRIFTVLPDDGDEQFMITVYENPDRQSAVQWYQAQVPGANLNQFSNFTNESGWVGIQSRDKRLIIATYGQSGAGARAFVFVMYYDPGTATALEYHSVWQMMANSLSVAETSTP